MEWLHLRLNETLNRDEQKVVLTLILFSPTTLQHDLFEYNGSRFDGILYLGVIQCGFVLRIWRGMQNNRRTN